MLNRILLDPNDPRKGQMGINPTGTGSHTLFDPSGKLMGSMSATDAKILLSLEQSRLQIVKSQIEMEKQRRAAALSQVRAQRDMLELEKAHVAQNKVINDLLDQRSKTIKKVANEQNLLTKSGNVILPSGEFNIDQVLADKKLKEELSRTLAATGFGAGGRGSSSGDITSSLLGGLGMGALGRGGGGNHTFEILAHKMGMGFLAPVLGKIGGGSLGGGIVRGLQLEGINRLVSTLTGGQIQPLSPFTTSRNLQQTGLLTGQGGSAGLGAVWEGFKLGANPFDMITMQMAQEIERGVRAKGFRGQIASAMSNSVGSVVNNLGIDWQNALEILDNTVRSGSTSVGEMNKKLVDMTSVMDNFKQVAQDTQQSTEGLIDNFKALSGPALAQGGQAGVRGAANVTSVLARTFPMFSKDQQGALAAAMSNQDLSRTFALMGGGNPLAPFADPEALLKGFEWFVTKGPAATLTAGEAISLIPALSGLQKGTLEKFMKAARSGQLNRATKAQHRLGPVNNAVAAANRAHTPSFWRQLWGTSWLDNAVSSIFGLGPPDYEARARHALEKELEYGGVKKGSAEYKTIMGIFDKKYSYHPMAVTGITSTGRLKHTRSPYAVHAGGLQLLDQLVRQAEKLAGSGADLSHMSPRQILGKLHINDQFIQAIEANPSAEKMVIDIIVGMDPHTKQALTAKGRARAQNALEKDRGTGKVTTTQHPHGVRRGK